MVFTTLALYAILALLTLAVLHAVCICSSASGRLGRSGTRRRSGHLATTICTRHCTIAAAPLRFASSVRLLGRRVRVVDLCFDCVWRRDGLARPRTRRLWQCLLSPLFFRILCLDFSLDLRQAITTTWSITSIKASLGRQTRDSTG